MAWPQNGLAHRPVVLGRRGAVASPKAWEWRQGARSCTCGVLIGASSRGRFVGVKAPSARP